MLLKHALYFFFHRFINFWAPKCRRSKWNGYAHIYDLRETAFARLLRSSTWKFYVKTSLMSPLHQDNISTFSRHNGFKTSVSTFSRHRGFKTSVSGVSTSRLLLLLLWFCSTNPFVSCEILLSRTYSGSFWRVSESRYSLISIQYWQVHRLILSCSLRYCISLWYWSDIVQGFS